MSTSERLIFLVIKSNSDFLTGNRLFNKMDNLSCNNTHFFSIVHDKTILILGEKNVTKRYFNFLQNWTWYKNKNKNHHDNQCGRKAGKVWLQSHLALDLRLQSLASTHHLGQII